MADQTILFEGQTVGSVVQGQEGILGSAVIVASSAHPMHGSKHARVLANSGSGSLRVNPTNGDRDVEITFYVSWSSLPVENFNLLNQFDVNDIKVAQLNLAGGADAGKLKLYSKGTLLKWTSPVVISAGTYYRIGLSVKAGTSSTTGSLRCVVYSGDSTTALADSGWITGINVADAVASLGNTRFGKLTTEVYAGDFDVDTVRIKSGANVTDTYDPYVLPFVSTTARILNGAWVSDVKTQYISNGAWV